MKVNETTYSDLKNISKKEKKIIESSFPFKSLDQNFNSIDLCGQKIDRNLDIGMATKICPLCDFPIIVRIMYLPCDHVVCYSCSKPEGKTCYVCGNEYEIVKRISDNTKLYECDFPDCLKFYESLEKLYFHKQNIHGSL